MKAYIYKEEKDEKYHIIVEAEGVTENLAIDALWTKRQKGYAEIGVDVMGLGIFVPYKEASHD